uniref:Uncharacterized protein n=1 Tax=Trichuris muris TaxID=70415 RepID=A0A5S6QSW1_TRIMR
MYLRQRRHYHSIPPPVARKYPRNIRTEEGLEPAAVRPPPLEAASRKIAESNKIKMANQARELRGNPARPRGQGACRLCVEVTSIFKAKNPQLSRRRRSF